MTTVSAFLLGLFAGAAVTAMLARFGATRAARECDEACRRAYNQGVGVGAARRWDRTS